MIVPPAALVALALIVGLLLHLGALVQDGAVRFQDQAAYNATVLTGAHVAHPVTLLAPEDSLVLALIALYWRRLPVLRRGFEPGTGLVGPIRWFQSGVVNDYVTWMVVGLACIGGALAFAIR
jgi:hypothetical protein